MWTSILASTHWISVAGPLSPSCDNQNYLQLWPGGLVSRLEHHPVHQKVMGLILGEGTYLSFGFDPQVRVYTGDNQLVPLSLSLPLFPSKINTNISYGEIKKTHNSLQTLPMFPRLAITMPG